jgi:hypothetical protein
MTTVPTTNPVQVLRNAADYLAVHGWNSGGFYRWSGGNRPPAACALGAIQIAVTGDAIDVFAEPDLVSDEQFTAILVAADIVTSHLRCTAQLGSLSKVAALARWNDRNGRTAEQVRAAMREAANRHENTGGGA